MAGEWIKMRSDLHDDPAVFRLASMLKIDKFAVIGRLHTFWSWADRHSVDGFVDGAASTDVDEIVRLEGFAASLVKVKWLEISDEGIRIPKFDRHNGDSAKQRAQKNERQARWRAKKDAGVDGDVDGSVDAEVSTSTSTREEKRREEKKETKAAPKGAAFDPVSALIEEGVQKQAAEDFMKIRKTKRAPLTSTALDGIRREAEKAGYTLAEAIDTCCARGWQGFNADWVTKDGAQRGDNNRPGLVL